MEDWIKLARVSALSKANVINAAMHSENIDTLFINKKDSAFVFLGYYDIYVRNDDKTKAEAVLATIADIEEEAIEADE